MIIATKKTYHFDDGVRCRYLSGLVMQSSQRQSEIWESLVISRFVGDRVSAMPDWGFDNQCGLLG